MTEIVTGILSFAAQKVQQFLPYYVHYILGQGGDGKLECAVCVWQD